MKTTRSLRLQIRALWAINLLLLAAVGLAATPAVRPLILNAITNQPTEPVSLAGPNWTGSPDSLTGLLYGNGAGNLSAATGAQVSALVTGHINPTGINIVNGGGVQGGYFTGNYIQVYGFAQIGNGGVKILSPNGALLTLAQNDGQTPADLAVGNLFASGALSSDGGALYSDGDGRLAGITVTAANTMTAPTFSFEGGGSLYANGGNVYYVDADGNFHALTFSN